MGPCLIHFMDAVKKGFIFMLTTHMQSGSFHKLPYVYLSHCMVPIVQGFLKFCMNLWMVRTMNLTVQHMYTVGLYPVVFPHMQCRPQQLLWAATQLPIYVCCIPYHLYRHVTISWQCDLAEPVPQKFPVIHCNNVVHFFHMQLEAALFILPNILYSTSTETWQLTPLWDTLK